MSKFLVSFSNSGGILDQRVVKTEEAAHQAALDLLNALHYAPFLRHGDRIEVEEISGDTE